jgi:hypothetical protein
MNDEEIEGMLRRATRARPSVGLYQRMGALFEAGDRRRGWILRLLQPVPVWALAAACILSAAGGFFANSLWRPSHTPTVGPTSLAICMIDPNRPLARRFLCPVGSETTSHRPDWRFEVRTTDTEKPQKP